MIVKKSSIIESTNNDDDELNIQEGNQAVQKVVHTNEKEDIVNKRGYWQMMNLERSFNPEAPKVDEEFKVEEIKEERDILLQQVNIALLIANIANQPTRF